MPKHQQQLPNNAEESNPVNRGNVVFILRDAEQRNSICVCRKANWKRMAMCWGKIKVRYRQQCCEHNFNLHHLRFSWLHHKLCRKLQTEHRTPGSICGTVNLLVKKVSQKFPLLLTWSIFQKSSASLFGLCCIFGLVAACWLCLQCSLRSKLKLLENKKRASRCHKWQPLYWRKFDEIYDENIRLNLQVTRKKSGSIVSIRNVGPEQTIVPHVSSELHTLVK